MMHAERGFSGENALKAAEIDKYYFFQKNIFHCKKSLGCGIITVSK